MPIKNSQPGYASSRHKPEHSFSHLLILWAGLYAISHIFAALVSLLNPHTPIEQKITLWPPSAPAGAWLERALLAPMHRWDVTPYLKIAARGYQAGDGTAQFHPLFPWLARPLILVGFHPLLALILVSLVASLLFIFILFKLFSYHYETHQTFAGVLFTITSPLAFALVIPYSESLFLLLAAWCLYLAQHERWWLAGVAGALATLTRQQGVVLLMPLSIMYLQQYGWRFWAAGKRTRRGDFLAILLIPGGYLAWLLFRAVILGDLTANFTSLHDFIYSVLISPSAVKIVPVQTFMWPWRALWLSIQKLLNSPDIDIVANLIAATYFLLVLLVTWKRLPLVDRWYVAIITLLSFSYHTGPAHPYMGLPRHLLLAFPVFGALGAAMKTRFVTMTLVAFGIMGQLLFIFLYVLHVWVP